MGIGPQYTMDGTRGTVRVAGAAAGQQVSAYAKSGNLMDAAWTVEQRKSTGGSMPPAAVGTTQPTTAPKSSATSPAVTAKSKPIVDEIKI